MARKIIITADDYGYVDHIDHGILEAVALGRITTVSCFTNIPRSKLIEKVKALKQINPDVGIGVHLTITSGKPLTNARSMRGVYDGEIGQYFCKTTDYNLDKVDLSELEIELTAQILQLADIIGMDKIDHLTNHHTFLYLDRNLFEVYSDIAKKYYIPVRSPQLWSNTEKKLLRTHDGKLAKIPIRGTAFRNAPKYSWVKAFINTRKSTIKKLKERLNSKKVAHPDILMDQIYGIPFVEDWIEYYTMINDAEVIEQMHHLSNPFTENQYQYPPWGIDAKYFQGRVQEKMALCGIDYSEKYLIECVKNPDLQKGTYRDFF